MSSSVSITFVCKSDRELIDEMRRSTVWGPRDCVYLTDDYYRELLPPKPPTWGVGEAVEWSGLRYRVADKTESSGELTYELVAL